jgi:hypothetical protein
MPLVKGLIESLTEVRSEVGIVVNMKMTILCQVVWQKCSYVPEDPTACTSAATIFSILKTKILTPQTILQQVGLF